MIFHGNCLDKLKELADNSVDSIVTDPPYGLSFMGKKWDYDVPSTEIWIEALRVLKPGGHLLAFFGTRTYHRGVVRIEDAGFEIRDQIMWIYASGFPKSHNIKEGEFKGFGTALKPANEPIVVARKPLEKGLTIAENVQKWGCGALNVDGARIATDELKNKVYNNSGDNLSFGGTYGKGTVQGNSIGRWPANIIFDEAAAEMLDEQSGDRKTGTVTPQNISRTQKSTYGKPTQNCNQESYGGGSGGASRFFKVIKEEENDINQQCKTTNVNTVKKNLETTPATDHKQMSSALKNAVQFIDSVNLCLSAKSATKNVKSIEIDSVLEVARMLNSSDHLLSHCQDYTLDSKNFTLIQSLVLIAETSENTDIIQTIQSLLKLCGCAHLVIDANIKQENLKNNKGPTRFLYQAKASKSERNRGLDSSDLIWEQEIWEKQDLNSDLMDMFQLARGTFAVTTMADNKWSIDSFGKKLTDLFPTATTFTILTALKLITELRTLSAFQSSIIKENTQDAIITILANGSSPVETAEYIRQLQPSITSEETESVLGVVLVVLPTLQKIKDFAKSGNFHSTVKPIKLMEYLIKLVTPPKGIVLDPFMGSGSTGVAAKNLGFEFIGIELNEEYIEIAKKRIETA